jgi:hypothetical protein
MIADKNTIYLAYNNNKSIVHQGYVFKGESIDSGLPIKEYFYNKSLFLKRLIELQLNNDVDFTDWVETELDITPPTLSPYAVKIPEIYQWAFPDNKFVLSGFEIPLDTHNNDKVVNLAYFMWAEFRAELDSGNYVALKRSLMPLWDYVELQVINQNLIVL